MKCSEFQTAIRDVLRAGSEEADGTVSQALTHAASCPRCAAQLAVERQLTEDLRALAASQAGEGASAAVEQRLLAAFRTRTQTQRQMPAPVPVIGWNWRLWGAVAAAVVVFALGGYTALRMAHRPNVTTVAKRPVQTNPVTRNPEVAGTVDEKREAAPVLARAAKPRRPARSTAPERSRPVPDEPQELATAFYAIPYAAPLQPEEASRIVRVSVPQSALAALGWPVRQEREMEAVDADLLVGEDNLARAIRLVSNRASGGPQLRPASLRSGRR